MTESPDLDAYFARIGYRGPREPTLSTLQALHDRHPRAIPFENLDPLLKRVPKLDVASLQEKLVRARRGGYCFEHNSLFGAVLRALGFKVTSIAARVQWMEPPNRINGRTHMLLRVDLPEGPYLADVGFGALVKTSPLRMQPGLEQPVGALAFRLAPLEDGELQLQVRLGELWTPMYRFSQTGHELADFEQANWWVATSPESRFVNGLMAAFVGPDRRYGLADNALMVRHDDGRTERRVLNARELDELLHGVFGIGRPEGVAALYQRVGRPTSSSAA